MSNQDKIITQFTDQKPLIDSFKVKINNLLKDLLQTSRIIPHQIKSRVKDGESLRQKIARKKEKYTQLTDITDIVGVRIITYIEDDVDNVAKVIEEEFVIDRENSVDKRLLESDRFGYRSLHYVVSLKENRLALKEYSHFTDFKAEIQIRSILQHAWAEIEHDLGYKGEFEIPQVARRKFSQIAALLEIADSEFLKLKNLLKEYKTEVSVTIETSPEKVLLDKASLAEYIKESSLVKAIDEEMSKQVHAVALESLPSDYNTYLIRLNFLNITTIKELDSTLKNYEKVIPPYFKLFRGIRNLSTTLPRGISIFYLSYVLAGMEPDKSRTESFYEYVFRKAPDAAFVQKLRDTWQKVKKGM